jgi:hypothetical protein
VNDFRTRHPRRRVLVGLTVAATTASMLSVSAGVASSQTEHHISRITSIVPAPVSARPDARDNFEITRQTRIVTANDKDSAAVGRYLADVRSAAPTGSTASMAPSRC